MVLARNYNNKMHVLVAKQTENFVISTDETICALEADVNYWNFWTHFRIVWVRFVLWRLVLRFSAFCWEVNYGLNCMRWKGEYSEGYQALARWVMVSWNVKGKKLKGIYTKPFIVNETDSTCEFCFFETNTLKVSDQL